MIKDSNNVTFLNWKECLLEFDFELEFIPGKMSIVADALSRTSFPNDISDQDNLQFMALEDGSSWSSSIDVLFVTLLKGLPDKTEESVSYGLMEIFFTFGRPKILQHDASGLEFCNSVVSNLCKLLSVEKRTISAYDPNSDGFGRKFQ